MNNCKVCERLGVECYFCFDVRVRALTRMNTLEAREFTDSLNARLA